MVEAVRGADRQVPVVIHTGANDTAAATVLSIHARAVGADAAGIISPAYYRLDEQALFDHFVAVAREVRDFPVFLYNIPSMTGNDIPPPLLLRIVRRADNVFGLKYSCDNLPQFQEYRKLMGASFALFIGDDSMALPFLRPGQDHLRDPVPPVRQAVRPPLADRPDLLGPGPGGAATRVQLRVLEGCHG